MVELLLLAGEGQVEALSDALVLELQARAVSVEDADAGGEQEQALFGEPGLEVAREGWRHSLVAALFDDEAQARAALELLQAQDWAQGVQPRGLRDVAEQDWVRLTQSQFAPVEIGSGLWVVPSWHVAPAQARHVLRLDPGLAFGTGTHPTTRMCLRWIAAHAEVLAGQRVLDYGCGSGILAIAAALFGAAAIDAVDIDPAALQATRDNARANGATAIEASAPDALAPPRGRYPLVLANILAVPLELLAPLLSAHLAPHGWLVLAGLLERQAAKLRAAYAPAVALEAADREDGWVLMTGQRMPDIATAA